MITRTRRPTHPGKILHDYFITARGLTVKSFASVMNIQVDHLQLIVDGKTNIPPCLALRLARCLNTSTHLWINLQAAVDTYDALNHS